MRLSYVAVLASLVPAVACATAEEITKGRVQLFDAGPMLPPVETGGDPGDLGSGGVVGSGGTSSGGVPPGRGGMLSTGGSNTGGKAAGGMTATGGKGGGVSGGGGTASGGSGAGGKAAGGATGGADPGDGGSCPSGQKFCGGVCTPPAPRNGCGLTGCDACTMTAPANGYITCASNQCVFDCLSGFTKMGDKCTGTGAGGSTGSCNVNSCPNCNVIQGPKCCTAAGKCGCPLIPYVTPTCA